MLFRAILTSCTTCDHAPVLVAGLKANKIGTVAVLGGGLMGSGIATALAMSGVQVILKEINQKFLDVSSANQQTWRPKT